MLVAVVVSEVTVYTGRGVVLIDGAKLVERGVRQSLFGRCVVHPCSFEGVRPSVGLEGGVVEYRGSVEVFHGHAAIVVVGEDAGGVVALDDAGEAVEPVV